VIKLGGNEVGCAGRCDISAIKFSLKVFVVGFSCHPLHMRGDVGELATLDDGVPFRVGSGCARDALFNVYIVRRGIS
jgi:hypothetical protein